MDGVAVGAREINDPLLYFGQQPANTLWSDSQWLGKPSLAHRAVDGGAPQAGAPLDLGSCQQAITHQHPPPRGVRCAEPDHFKHQWPAVVLSLDKPLVDVGPGGLQAINNVRRELLRFLDALGPLDAATFLFAFLFQLP